MNIKNMHLPDIENARRVRKLRSDIKKDLKTGKISIKEAFSDASIYNDLKEMKVFDILCSLPKKGRVSAINVMKEMKISTCKKISGLGKKQRLEFFKHFGLENMKQEMENGRLFVISGPSGAGKSTLIEEVLKKLDKFVASVSVTTRPKRKNETEGKKYIFITDSDFDELIQNEKLLEHAVYCGYKYGTPKEFVKKELSRGNNIILEIEVQGAIQVKKSMPDAYMIFIMSPTIEELKKRLHFRNTENSGEIEKRLNTAMEELYFQKHYDCIIVNNDYNEALLNLKYILNEQTKQGSVNINGSL